jgi:methionyl-tRNA formyltransferase
MTDRLRIVFAGTPEFSVPALDALHAAGHDLLAVYTQPDRPAGRDQAVTASPVKERACALGLPIVQPATLRTTEAAEALAALEPDLMVVVAYGLVLPPAILGIPRLGCWNIHASLLPRWRGAAPIQRAILAGDATTGITIMQMDAGLDTGPMLLAQPLAIGPRDSGGQLHDRLSTLGAESIVAAVDEWLAGRLVAAAQPAGGATYAAKIHKAEALIDWRQAATQIDRQVRAFNPWPVAETRWDGRQLRVWEARPVAEPTVAAPGQVIESADGRLLVAAGQGALELGRVQLAGRRAVTAAEFRNAHPLAGVRLGA